MRCSKLLGEPEAANLIGGIRPDPVREFTFSLVDSLTLNSHVT